MLPYTTVWIYSCIFVCIQGQVWDAYIKFHSQPGNNKCDFHDTIHVTLQTNDSEHFLGLKRNDDIDTQLPLYSISADTEGNTLYKRHYDTVGKKIAVYQDLQNGASLLIQCINEVSETDGHFLMDGHLYLKNSHYRIEPVLTNGQVDRHPDNKYKHRYSLSVQEDHHSCHVEKPSDDNFNAPSSKQKRIKRETATLPPIVIDISVHVDKEGFKAWQDRSKNDEEARAVVKKYFTHVISGINLRYQSMKPDLNVVVRPISITIHEIERPFTDGIKEIRNGVETVNAEHVLTNLTSWIQSNTNTVGNYDHVMLFTGYDLYSTGNEEFTAGLASVGTLCKTDGTSVSVVEDRGGYQSIVTATHELGHGTNAEHDGSGNPCKALERYIMSPRTYNETAETALNPWKFSSCSKDSFKAFLSELVNNSDTQDCVTKSISQTGIPNITNELAGQLYGPDEQCRHIFSADSYVCRDRIFGNETDICRKMFCHVTGTLCRGIIPAQGTSCGDKKWCIQGECVANIRAPDRAAGCIYGDHDGTVPNAKESVTCNDIKTTFNGYCYKGYADSCCETCAQVKTNNSDCLYGDKAKDCNVNRCGKKLENSDMLYDVDCCGTCEGITTDITSTTTTTTTSITPSCTDVPSVNGKTCSEYLQDRGSRQCYEPKTKEACCASCRQRKENILDCEYGDKPEVCDISSCGKPVEGGGTYTDACCKTCATDTTPSTPTMMTDTPCVDNNDIDGMTCAVYITKNGKASCYLSNVVTTCCQTCTAYKVISQPGCEYGDREASCSSVDFTSFAACGTQSKQQCCESCAKLKEQPVSPCNDTAGIGGLSCNEYIAKNKKVSCYNEDVKRLCCKSCHFVADDKKKGCEYGDLYADTCNLLDFSKYDNCGTTTKFYCCDKCLKLDDSDNADPGNAIRNGGSTLLIVSLLCIAFCFCHTNMGLL
ncbi:uncharacterized protein LOC126823880 [Patella vulgata]|uniref:uncharacterized protein LOC126823880 n=1 Tax=Patella vulgata TaxID=6465 RepID=UPI00217FC071|nr:uncharacterized protein LOC126823880 [Patella vulgata]